MSDVGDWRVTTTQAYKFYHALSDNHVPVVFITYPVPGHSPADPVAGRVAAMDGVDEGASGGCAGRKRGRALGVARRASADLGRYQVENRHRSLSGGMVVRRRQATIGSKGPTFGPQILATQILFAAISAGLARRWWVFPLPLRSWRPQA